MVSPKELLDEFMGELDSGANPDQALDRVVSRHNLGPKQLRDLKREISKVAHDISDSLFTWVQKLRRR